MFYVFDYLPFTHLPIYGDDVDTHDDEIQNPKSKQIKRKSILYVQFYIFFFFHFATFFFYVQPYFRAQREKKRRER